MKRSISSWRVVTTSFGVDVTDVVLNLVLAVISGSAVMLVQALQGGADLITSGLLIIGVKQSKRAADKRHHFGYGREVYFWTLMSGVMMLTVTATLSFYHGWQHVIEAPAIANIPLALIVLVIGFFTNSYALSLSYKRLRAHEENESIWETFNDSVLVETKAAFVLDLMGTLSAIVGFIALSLYELTGNSQFDGLGAMVIGVGVAVLALLLIIDVKDLLVGRSVSGEIQDQIKATALAVKGVEKVLGLQTMYIGSEKLLVNLDVDLAPHLRTEQIEQLIEIIKSEVKTKVPSVKHIQVELQTGPT